MTTPVQECRTQVRTRLCCHACLTSENLWNNPEITAVEMLGGTDAYFDWLKRTVEPTEQVRT